MKTIYLACVDYDHEGYDVIAAFESEDAADAFLAPQRAYLALKPAYHGCWSDAAANEAWTAAMKKWHEDEPEGFRGGDGYSVLETELHT